MLSHHLICPYTIDIIASQKAPIIELAIIYPVQYMENN